MKWRVMIMFNAVGKGILKVMSKMGISFQSYNGAQICDGSWAFASSLLKHLCKV